MNATTPSEKGKIFQRALLIVSKQYQARIGVPKFIVTAMIIYNFELLKLNGCRGFGGVVEQHAVDVFDLVDDAAGGGG